MIPQIVSAVLGLWLMVAPAVMGHSGDVLSKVDRTAGPFIAAVSALAATQICRSLRWINWVTALVLLIAPWFLEADMADKVNSAVVGAAVFALTPWGHPDQSKYGNGWMTLGPLPELPEWGAAEGEAQERRTATGS